MKQFPLYPKYTSAISMVGTWPAGILHLFGLVMLKQNFPLPGVLFLAPDFSSHLPVAVLSKYPERNLLLRTISVSFDNPFILKAVTFTHSSCTWATRANTLTIKGREGKG